MNFSKSVFIALMLLAVPGLAAVTVTLVSNDLTQPKPTRVYSGDEVVTYKLSYTALVTGKYRLEVASADSAVSVLSATSVDIQSGTTATLTGPVRAKLKLGQVAGVQVKVMREGAINPVQAFRREITRIQKALEQK